MNFSENTTTLNEAETQTLVSVVIPNFNKAPFILDTLVSLQQQTYSSWEAIVVDDNSTDGSMQIARDVASKDCRVKVISNDTKISGGSACRNIGIELAQGQRIIFLDSDDLLADTCLQHRLSVTDPKSDLSLFPMSTFIHDVGDGSMIWVPREKDALRRFLSHQLPWVITCGFWKKKFLIDLKGFDSSFPRLQDVELHTRALTQSNRTFQYHQTAADCFYRRSTTRTKHSVFAQEQKNIDGCIKYASKFYALFENTNAELISELNGTLFAAWSGLARSYRRRELSKVEFLELRSRLQSSSSFKQLFGVRHIAALKFYRALNFLLGERIHRVNPLFCKIICSI